MEQQSNSQVKSETKPSSAFGEALVREITGYVEKYSSEITEQMNTLKELEQRMQGFESHIPKMQKRIVGIFKRKPDCVQPSLIASTDYELKPAIKKQCYVNVKALHQAQVQNIDGASDYQVTAKCEDFIAVYSQSKHSSSILRISGTECIFFAQLKSIKVETLFIHDTRMICNKDVFQFQRGRNFEKICELEFKQGLCDGITIDPQVFLFNLDKNATLYVCRFDRDKQGYRRLHSLGLKYRGQRNAHLGAVNLTKIGPQCFCTVSYEAIKFDLVYLTTEDDKLLALIKYGVIPHDIIYNEPNRLDWHDMKMAPDQIHMILQNTLGHITVVDQFKGQPVACFKGQQPCRQFMPRNFDIQSNPVVLVREGHGLVVRDLAGQGYEGALKLPEGVEVLEQVGAGGDGQVTILSINTTTRQLFTLTVRID
ncbi:hypothetical protein FGO68_gene17149 [Halteria grandinella]|uniref:Uncharacterized protein n=1 Tax=Halteria grandinella TaxID=5974 RepID=A0A8J8P0D1_HALGN|nr:hypothetical protein FGO68_gene17149 [Halteria grandinella]